ncbi:MAG TPA: aldo/keto reductase [Candidatus Binatus sp.]|nr:aldo/keto reductase [Candidatus Binatus sp.]
MPCTRCGGQAAEDLVRVRPWITAAVFATALAASWVILGPAFHDLIEGMERGAVITWKLVLPPALLAAAVASWTIRLRRPVCAACGSAAPAWLWAPLRRSRADRWIAMPGRRRVLRQLAGVVGASVAGAAGLFSAVLVRNRGWFRVGRNLFTPVETASPTFRPEWRGARVRSYRRLGRTGAMVSDVSLGSANIQSVEVARLALDRGVTYFDTSPDYSSHGSEEVLGEALSGRRDQVFVASKFCTGDGHLPPETPVPRIIEAVEGSLRRLRTDHLDLLHIHSCDRLERLLAPSFHEAFDRLKEQGKARFLGVSSHTPNLSAVANAAIDSGRFDVLMLAYHHGMGWELDRILDRAAERDVAVVAMKTLKGAKHRNLAAFRDDATSYTQAAFRWVLSNPKVSCLVISFSELPQVDEYLYASGTQLTSADHAVLARYDALITADYCRPHCGACLDSCVASLPINDVLRYQMYFQDYGAKDEAKRLYGRLGDASAAQCASCPAPCAGACPYGLPIQQKMHAAHAILSRA